MPISVEGSPELGIGGATWEKKKGKCRFSWRDLRLGKAGTAPFRGKREGSIEPMMEGGARSNGGGWWWALKELAAAAAAAAAIVENQGTC